jgi:hypothetical protein
MVREQRKHLPAVSWISEDTAAPHGEKFRQIVDPIPDFTV